MWCRSKTWISRCLVLFTTCFDVFMENEWANWDEPRKHNYLCPTSHNGHSGNSCANNCTPNHCNAGKCKTLLCDTFAGFYVMRVHCRWRKKWPPTVCIRSDINQAYKAFCQESDHSLDAHWKSLDFRSFLFFEIIFRAGLSPISQWYIIQQIIKY